MASTAADAPNLAELRRDYALKTLDEGEVDRDPLKQFGTWMFEAIQAQVPEPTAMTLATADAKGRPSARIVLLKGLDPRGFVFYTNYQSRKGKNLAQNPLAAMTFLWKELERQVRIEGKIEKVTPQESAAYYATRPLGSRIGAWASPQSVVVAGQSWLIKTFQYYTERFKHGKIPKPPHWGGYRVKPVRIEFWQGRPNRMHDRILYTEANQGSWKIERLAP